MNKKLKFCPDCGTNIENIGDECPDCGYVINKEIDYNKSKENKIDQKNTSKKEEKIEKEEKNKDIYIKVTKKKIFIFIILTLVLFLLFIFFTGKLNFGNKNEKGQEKSEIISEINKEELNNEENEGIYVGETRNVSEYTEEEKKSENLGYINDYPYYFSKVKSEKAFFYDENNNMSQKKSYIIAGDIVLFSGPMIETNFKEDYIYVSYTANNGTSTSGYLKEIDLVSATKEEVKKEIERLDNIDKKTKLLDEDEENKKFLISHYNDIKNKNYYTAFHNYQYPKAKNVDDFAGWYKGVYEINLSEIEKIGKNEYRYVVSIYSDTGLNKIETSIKVGKVDGKLKILGYGTKQL